MLAQAEAISSSISSKAQADGNRAGRGQPGGRAGNAGPHRGRPGQRRAAAPRGVRHGKTWISFAPPICPPGQGRRRCRRPWRRPARRWGGMGEIQSQRASVAARARRSPWPSGDWRNAVSARRRPGAWPTFSPGQAKPSRPARPSYRCCRPATFSFASSCRNAIRDRPRRSGGPRMRRLPGGSVRDNIVHFASGRIHAASDLQPVEQGKLVFIVEARPRPDQATSAQSGGADRGAPCRQRQQPIRSPQRR